jgi:type 1 glutamine amidotransferase
MKSHRTPSRRSFLTLVSGAAGASIAARATAQEAPNEAQRRADEEEAARRAGQKKPEPQDPPFAIQKGKPSRALFVYGGWPGHQPDKCRDLFVPWLKKNGFQVTVSDSLDAYTDEKLMGTLDLIVQIWTMGTIKGEQLKGLLRAVNKRGVGLAGWHGGLGDAFRQETEYEFMVGGNWVSHPGGVIPYRVNIVDHEDPITAGLTDFDLRTEQYYMHVDPNNKVLATTKFSGEHAYWIEDATMPVAWKRVYGHGRVFYTSMGHTADVFDTPPALTIAQRGILWASRSRYEATPNLISPVYPSR